MNMAATQALNDAQTLESSDPATVGKIQLQHLGFVSDSEICIKVSFDHEASLKPDWWAMKQDGETPVNYVFMGKVTVDGISVQKCQWKGEDKDGNSIWKPSGETYNFDHFRQLGSEGATVYFYPNKPSGGISNAHIKTTDLVFYEIDDLPLNEQWEALERLKANTGLVPCVVVFTGGKSLHVYFRLSEGVSQTDWRRLSRKLCILQSADHNIVNPARAMRLAGIPRRKSDDFGLLEPKEITVEFVSDEIYSPNDFEARLDATGAFPNGLSDNRWSQWVTQRNKQKNGNTTVDPAIALNDPDLDQRIERDRAAWLKQMAEKGDSEHDEEITTRLVNEILSFIPPRSKGGNSYQLYRKIAACLKNHYGEAAAISMMESHSPSRQCGWNVAQVVRSSKGTWKIGSLINTAKDEFGWTFPQWTRDAYRNKAKQHRDRDAGSSEKSSTSDKPPSSGSDQELQGVIAKLKSLGLAIELEEALSLPWNRILILAADRCVPTDGKDITAIAKILIEIAATKIDDLEARLLIAKLSEIPGLGRQPLNRLLKQFKEQADYDRRKQQAKQAQQEREAEQERRQQEAKSESRPYIPIEFDNKTGKPITPKAGVVDSVLSQFYQKTLSWNPDRTCFYRYGTETQGVWSSESREFVEQLIKDELNSNGLDCEYSADYVKSVYSLMSSSLACRNWSKELDSDLLPFQNGILRLSTREFSNHSPDHRLTWQLPYSYVPGATCEPIIDWLRESQNGDEKIVELLRAYLKAILCGRADLQRFIECVGKGGTGKSTYIRLAQALIGFRNCFVTELKQLEGNRFETAGIYGKRLVVITDSERYGGSVSILKALTGQDALRLEEKRIQQKSEGFMPNAMVLIACNEPIQSADYTTGFTRRRLSIPFENQIAKELQRDLISIGRNGVSGEFAEFLPGLVNWVLDMPDQQMFDLIKNTDVSVPSLNASRLESIVESNPLAAWLDSRCVFDADSKTYVGNAVKYTFSESPDDGATRTTRTYWEGSETLLYPSYIAYSNAVGTKPVSLQRFSRLLSDLCVGQLGHAEAKKERDSKGAHFVGLRFRTSDDVGIPRPITGKPESDFNEEVVSDVVEIIREGIATNCIEEVVSAVFSEVTDTDRIEAIHRLSCDEKKVLNFAEGRRRA
ncbi:MAG: hypothetical protein KME13_11350 [Myxacorys californica WJT36-NPBG1]|jgi:P4 family phage/plasmid primase-like protien|nr:hypothetical protein [Myxacorys californica WJT36-NPBG1]